MAPTTIANCTKENDRLIDNLVIKVCDECKLNQTPGKVDNGIKCHINYTSTYITLMILLSIIIMIIFMIGTLMQFKHINPKASFVNAKKILIQSLWLMIGTGVMSYGVQQQVYPDMTFDQWFNTSAGATGKTVIVGMMANVIFGFIDNAGLFFGSNYLEEVFSKLPGGATDANVTAGYGNTYSDTLGAFMGTFIGMIFKDLTGVESGPLWAEIIGIIIGCLLGIAIPKMILKNSSNMGLNKICARNCLLGSMDYKELKVILENKKTVFDYRSETVFDKLDGNGNGTLDQPEIKKYLETALGADYDENAFVDMFKQEFTTVNLDDDANSFTVDEFKKIYLNMAKCQLNEKKKLLPNKL